ncbi:hypothetical protein SESBI_29264 [Sesbania bispinosa]|nr:hypothetical protein SESBI_29264 [Sesbania bispinosa]
MEIGLWFPEIENHQSHVAKVTKKERVKVGKQLPINRFVALNIDSSQANHEEVKSGNNGKESSVTPTMINSKILQRKKRPRKEPVVTFPKIFVEGFYEKILGKNSLPKSKSMPRMEEALTTKNKPTVEPTCSDSPSSSKDHVNIFPNGVKTTLNVEMISPNQLRFVEEPKPPDLQGIGVVVCEAQREQLFNNSVNMEEVVAVEETSDDSEMVEETPM